MLEIHGHEQMSRRGATLVELMAGVVTAAIIAAASAGLLKAGMMTYTASVRQNEALTKLRKAVGSEGSATGILPVSRGAYAVNALNAAQLAVLSSSSAVVMSYYASAGNLIKSQGGVPATHAESIGTIAVNYYNTDSNGLVVESTTAAGARLVTALVTYPAKTNKLKDHKLFAGTLLRNMP